ncbi:efflux RND transporter periplasmic adaptor subunit [Alkalilimnicola ehrlichii MLHE-1]|uniref:Efflux transporter, RND family, MFP subunit n=1 Tax=Alkalilimnicola ehrlichii (strain ATCC BAA-1101 / DSM 17681 / MLHE-1) TaxID=187272 RepID=Q0AAA0_ALKEH|nr:efflux RND transporter periplasmic adaptor subunit [Alkalilimnicola ehrlichii]ABI56237.1 efflux transporter, RND family, MFP subunit [Alkalilimnicola ehrlichii MLHE-1]
MPYPPRTTVAPRLPALLLLLGLLAGVGPSDARADDNDRDAPRATPVIGVEITPRDLSRRVSVAGNLEPLRRVRVTSRIAGALSELDAEVGDRVAEGELLARIDVSEQRAELARAEARLVDAEARYERYRRLRERDLASTAEFEAMEAELRVAQSERELWRARVRHGEVRAPLDGTVLHRPVEAGDGIGSGDLLFELAEVDTLLARIGVSELDIQHLQRGQTALLRPDALGGEPIAGEIRRIHPSADPSSRLVTVEVAIDAETPAGRLRPGYLTRVTLMVDPRPGRLAVPSQALGAAAPGEHYVYVIANGQLEQREVQAGVSRRGWTEILQGLATGEVVLAVNPLTFNEGDRVRVIQWYAGDDG